VDNIRVRGGYLVLFILVSLGAFAQNNSFNPHSKGHAFFQWGWNRGLYTNSTLTLKGADYDLVLKKVVAHDRPTTPVSYHNYLQPDRLTIPQNNWRLGYFIKDDLAITFGTDHMKYVMDQNQTVTVNGNISREGIYKGVYNNQPMALTEDFLTFEHTDGLNYLNVELEKYNRVAASKNSKIIFNLMYGGGTGILFPKTNAKLLDYERNDRFHVAGFGVSAKAAVELVFFKRLLLKFEAKEGFINMPDIILHAKGVQGKGRQAFFFTEFDGVLGWSFMAHKPRASKADKKRI
jgi:hypothetical protein